MIEALSVIILLPIAIVAVGILAFGAYLYWRYLAAVGLWIAAGAVLLYGVGANEDMTWWALGTFMAGCLMLLSAQDSKSEKQQGDI